MKIFDTHVHIDNFAVPDPDRLLQEMDLHGVERTALLSEEPAYLETDIQKLRDHNAQRLDRLMQWCAHSDGRLVPIYFLCPIERDALEQVDRALEKGVTGFKIICETHYPGDERAMPVYQYIADAGKSILFHSGILWDWGNNGNFNRPCNWECMFDVKNIRFALAHISWPWTDECISLYGKFCAMYEHPRYAGQKMYIDMTPGTPECYRRHVIQTLHDVGYWGLDQRLMFGTDNFTGQFDAAFTADLAESDRRMMTESGFSDEFSRRVLYDNAMEFWGIGQ